MEEIVEQVRRDGLAGDLVALGIVERAGDVDFHLFARDFAFFRHRIGYQHAAVDAEQFAHVLEVGDRRRAVQHQRALEAAVARPEGREDFAVVGDDRDTAGFEHFERLRNVEDRLGAGADDDDAGAGKFVEVGGDVEAEFGAAVHATDAAGRKDANAGAGSGNHRRGNGRCARAALGDREREVGARDLHRTFRLRQLLELGVIKADMQHAMDDGDRCRHGTLFADDRFDAAGHVQIAGIGHAMGDDGRFQRHDRRATRLGGCDLVGICHRQGGRSGFGHGLSLGVLLAIVMTAFGAWAQEPAPVRDWPRTSLRMRPRESAM
ncbi:hypothetical protein D9M68_401730 [compost metagenome]